MKNNMRLFRIQLFLLIAINCILGYKISGMAQDSYYTLGIEGYYVTEAKAALDRVNEIRLEACKEGVLNPSTNKPLTEADYVPMTWSSGLEEIARIRAAEGSVYLAHQRPNGEICSSVTASDGTSTDAENLAWNWTEKMGTGIEQWYGEKTDWVNQTQNAVTGHYESMINPEYLSMALACFISSDTKYKNTLAGEFSSNKPSNEIMAAGTEKALYPIQVSKDKVTGFSINGTTELQQKEKENLLLTIMVKASLTKEIDLTLMDTDITWQSDKESVAKVIDGQLKTLSVGNATITASDSADMNASLAVKVVHTEEIDEAVEPTCTKTGLTEGSHCSVCGEVLIEQKEIQAKGHTEEIDEAVEPTCTKTGLTEGSHCSVCGEVLIEQKEIQAKGHTEEIDEAVEPTCTKTGLTEGSHCSVCDEVLVEQEVVQAKGHKEVTDEAVEPTCTKTGLTEGKHCSVCGEVLIEQKEIQAKGHTEEIDEAVEPTCTKTGLTEGSHCSVCGEVLIEQKEIQAKGHTEEIDKAVEPTCTKTGLTEGSHCSVCGEVLIEQKEIQAKGHTEEIDEAVEPTCTETGLTEGKHCSVCGEVLIEQKEIQAKGHTEEIDEAVEPTCTKTGLTEGSHCSVCDEVLVEQEVVQAKGHKEVTDEAVEPTCTKTGLTEGSHCSVCGEVLIEQKEIQAKGHTEEIDEAVEPTCTKTGLTEGSHCSVCGDVIIEQKVIPAQGHTVIVDKNAVAPTCTKSGLTEESHCSVCNDVLQAQKEIPALGHKAVVDKAVAATATKTGLTEGSHCSVCGCVIIEQKVIPIMTNLSESNSGTQTVSANSLTVSNPKTNAASVVLQVKQSTTGLTVSGLAAGDRVTSYTSSDKKIFKVSSKGKITAVKKGNAVLKIQLLSGKTLNVNVKVQKTPVRTTKISIDKKAVVLKMKESHSLKPSITPFTSKEKITYKSSNKKVATVSGKGKITAKAKGTAVITIKSGKKSVKCKITVK